MIINVGTLKAKPGMEKELEEMLKAVVEKVQSEEGTVTYTLHRAKEDPGQFLFYEVYKDQESFEHHASRPHVPEFMSNVGNFVTEAKMTFYEIIASKDSLR